MLFDLQLHVWPKSFLVSVGVHFAVFLFRVIAFSTVCRVYVSFLKFLSFRFCRRPVLTKKRKKYTGIVKQNFFESHSHSY